MNISHGYIFRILQHFAAKHCNFTNFNMLFCGDGFRSSCLDQDLVYSWNHPLLIIYIKLMYTCWADKRTLSNPLFSIISIWTISPSVAIRFVKWIFTISGLNNGSALIIKGLSIKGITIEFYQIGSGLEITDDPDRSMIGKKFLKTV